MIEILQPEINVVPGDTPRTPADRGWVGQGRTVITVTNDTNRNNSYRIHLECGNPRWKSYWYSFVALPPDNAAAVVQNQEDVYGPNNAWVQVYVPQKQSRRIILDVKVDRLPEARAGIYQLNVVVKVSIAGNQGGTWIEDATHRLEAVALMRPYYQWKFRVEPEIASAGIFRRARPYEVVIENSGNDWLYCELEPPRPQKLLVEQPPTVRIAIPPPEDNRLPSIRTVPFRAVTKQRMIRGSHQDTPIPMVVRRVDAPSVPSLPATALQAPASAQYRNAVVMRDPEQRDAQKPPVDPILSYHPPIPATIEGCGKALVQNLKGLIMLALGLFVLFHLWDFMAASLIDQASINPDKFQIENSQKKKFPVTGRYLFKSKVLVYADDQPGNPQYVLPSTAKPLFEVDALPVVGLENRYTLDLSQVPDNSKIFLRARRKVMLNYLSGMIRQEKPERDQAIEIGHVARSDYQLSGDPIQIGKDFTLVTPGYAANVKMVRLGSVDLKNVRADGTDRVIAHAPDSYPGVNPGSSVQVDVSVFGTDTSKALATFKDPVSLEGPQTTPPPGTDGQTPGTTPGGSPGSGTSPGSGASKPASPGATAATKAIAQNNWPAAKAAAAQNPTDPDAQALNAIACYKTGDQAGGDAALKIAQAAAADSMASPRTLILAKTAEAVKLIATGGSPDVPLSSAMETAKQSDNTVGLPFLIAVQYYKAQHDNTMANSAYGDAKVMPIPADEKAMLEKLIKG